MSLFPWVTMLIQTVFTLPFRPCHNYNRRVVRVQIYPGCFKGIFFFFVIILTSSHWWLSRDTSTIGATMMVLIHDKGKHLIWRQYKNSIDSYRVNSMLILPTSSREIVEKAAGERSIPGSVHPGHRSTTLTVTVGVAEQPLAAPLVAPKHVTRYETPQAARLLKRPGLAAAIM